MCGLLWPRSDLYHVDCEASLARLMRRLGVNVLFMDLHPAIAPWGGDRIHANAGITRFQYVMGELPMLRQVIYASNGPIQHGFPPARFQQTIIEQACKPWKLRRCRDAISGSSPVPLICGDQLLTDGLLARRIGAPFALWRVGVEGRKPVRVRILDHSTRALRTVVPLFFRHLDVSNEAQVEGSGDAAAR